MKKEQALPWWKTCVFYQIYPRSFQDSNGDGIGDLNGITARLDYLQSLGVGALWLCPVYDSPGADMGYDIRNYEAILPEYGTREDFSSLLEGLHARGMRLVMDLVVNHTSDEHPWFVDARSSRRSAHRDYYLWRNGKSGGPPNNWASFFTPSAWTYEEATEQWYLHLFSEQQPDLNWENPRLRQEIYAMMNRWLELGVDGFRMDVITLLAKRPGLPDGYGAPNRAGFVSAPEHFALQPALHTYLREMRRHCFDGRSCMCVGEATFATSETARSLVADGRELDLLFAFDLMEIDSGRDKWDLQPFSLLKWKEIVTRWQRALDWNTLFLSNHDQPRPVSRWGCTRTEALRARSAKLLGCMMHLMRGTSFVYQGEELGMTNCSFPSPEALRDVESLNFLKGASQKTEYAARWNSVLQKGRDHARTPMQWDDSSFAGFSSAPPWIAVNPNYKVINRAAQEQDPFSVLQFYRRLLALKTQEAAFVQGAFSLLDWGGAQALAFCRTWNAQRFFVFCNVSDTPCVLKEPYQALPIRLCNVAAPQPGLLQPWEARVCETQADVL